MVETSPSFAPRIPRDVAWVELDGEIVVLDATTSHVHVLSQTAALLFPLLDGHVTLGELADDVAAVFSVTAEQALADVLRFCEDLRIAGLLEEEPGDGE